MTQDSKKPGTGFHGITENLWGFRRGLRKKMVLNVGILLGFLENTFRIPLGLQKNTFRIPLGLQKNAFWIPQGLQKTCWDYTGDYEKKSLGLRGDS